MERLYPTTPAADFPISVDFSDIIGKFVAGTVLQAIAVTIVATPGTGSDPTPSDRLEGAPVIDVTSKIASQRFKAPVAGVRYILTFDPTFTNGAYHLPICVEIACE